MKKLSFALILAFIGSVSSLFYVFANQTVQINAIVGTANHSPIVSSVTPSSDPKLLARNKIQNYSLYFRDDEKDSVTYTITPVSGFTNPLSGTILPSAYDSASGAYINFTYLSPTTVPSPNPTTVTITLNDGSSVISKDIHVFIY